MSAALSSGGNSSDYDILPTVRDEATVRYDIQNVPRVLVPSDPEKLRQPESWIKITAPTILHLPLSRAGEIHVALEARTLSLQPSSTKLTITPIFDGITSESSTLDLVLAHGEVAFRLSPPLEWSSGSIRVEANSADVEISTDIKVAQVETGLSAIIAIYKEEERIQTLLDSFAAQTAEVEKFELIFVINGPKDGSEEIIRSWQCNNPRIASQIHYDAMPSLSNARNVGIKFARFSSITFIDADDQVSPMYIESMLERISPDFIACSHLQNIDDDGNIVTNNLANDQLLQVYRPREFLPEQASALSTMSCCKAIPTFMARCVPFITHLKNGEDTPFYCEIYARFPRIKLNADEDPERCVYVRHVRQGSLSRPVLNYDFYIPQRLDVIKEISRIISLPQTTKIRNFNLNKRNAQVDFMSAYLLERPEDYLKTLTEIEGHNIPDFPVDRLKDRASRNLLVAYCFPPFQDASAIVMAKRVYEQGQICDVISNSMADKREVDQRLLTPLTPLLARHHVLKCPIAFSDWKGIRKFAEKAHSVATEIQRNRSRQYRTLYSRAQWVGSHFAAIQIKLGQPDIFWTAEFSDPLFHDVEGRVRKGDLQDDWLTSSGLLRRLDELGVEYDPEQRNLFYWCELAAVHLADKLVFTNENQLAYMLSYQETEHTQRTMSGKAEISPHPVARGWLTSPDSSNEPSYRNLNLAYFGSFYSNRGPGALLNVLHSLPESERFRTRFYIYSRQHQDAVAEAQFLGLSDIVICKPELPYADMINELHKFDILVVTDAQVDVGQINPFLPSKLSDYKQSDVPIMSIFQPGSAMSRMDDIPYKIASDLPQEEFKAEMRTLLQKARSAKRQQLLQDLGQATA